MLIPEISIIAEGASPDAAYAELAKEKERYFQRMIDMRMQDAIKEPVVRQIRKEWAKDFMLFASKTLIVFLLIIILSYSILLPILSSVDKFIGRKLQEIPAQTFSKTIDKIDGKLATMSTEEKNEMRGKLRNIAKNLRPFVDDLKSELDRKANGAHPRENE